MASLESCCEITLNIAKFKIFFTSNDCLFIVEKNLSEQKPLKRFNL